MSSAAKRLSPAVVIVALGAGAASVWPDAHRWALRLVLAFVSLVLLAVAGVRQPRTTVLNRRSTDPSHAEINRARRYARAVSLVRMRAAVPAAADEIAASLAKHLRADDHAWVEGRDVMVVLPEANRGDATAFVRRFQRMLDSVCAAQVVIASFPEDGATYGALAEALGTADPLAPVPAGVEELAPALLDLRQVDVPTVRLKLAEIVDAAAAKSNGDRREA